MEDTAEVTCPRCGVPYPLTEEFFYVARKGGVRKKTGWQSYCKNCWVSINKDNRERRLHIIKIQYVDSCDIREKPLWKE